MSAQQAHHYNSKPVGIRCALNKLLHRFQLPRSSQHCCSHNFLATGSLCTLLQADRMQRGDRRGKRQAGKQSALAFPIAKHSKQKQHT